MDNMVRFKVLRPTLDWILTCRLEGWMCEYKNGTLGHVGSSLATSTVNLPIWKLGAQVPAGTPHVIHHFFIDLRGSKAWFETYMCPAGNAQVWIFNCETSWTKWQWIMVRVPRFPPFPWPIWDLQNSCHPNCWWTSPVIVTNELLSFTNKC